MKYLNLFLLSVLLLFSCSPDEERPNPDNDISGSRIKPFSSCNEIEGIVSDLLYNNRDLNDESINTEEPHSFRCEWEQEQKYDPNDMFIMRVTNVRTNYEAAHLTQEELIERQTALGVQQVTDKRLNQSVYDNVVVAKSFNQVIKANTYTAYIWVEDERINRIIIEDINMAENVPELLDDASVADIFIQMLIPAG
ncbi:MAG: hypothetical protein ACTIJ2_00065 [Sphingobacteriaceae bacterium]